MNRDKLKIYFLELLLLFFLLFTLFESNIITRLVLAFVLLGYMFICMFFLRKREILPIYHKQVFILMCVFAFIYLAVFYLMGLYFGYYESTVKLSLWSAWNYIIPLTVIIISSEVIRHIFLSQKSKRPKILVLTIMVLIDLIIYVGVYDLSNLSDFLTVIGFILFASVSCNLLYNYVSIRFDYKGIIVYRIITALYVYFIPVVPDVYIFFRSILRMIYPYMIYLVINYTFVKRDLAADYIKQKKKVFNTTMIVIFTTIISMLVSCQFRFGIIVIGSGSMTGTLNVGDAVVYEKYTNQDVNEGDIVIFNGDGIRIIHRVVDVKKINGEVRYYTKGDANVEMDEDYITKKDIIGFTRVRIKYIGYPSIWVRDIFS